MKRLILGREHVDATGAVDQEIMLGQLGQIFAALGYPAPYRGGADPSAIEFRPFYVYNDPVEGPRYFSPPNDGSDPTDLANYEEYFLCDCGDSGSVGCKTILSGSVDDVPIADDALDLEYVLGVDTSGCIMRFPAGPC